MTKHNIGTRQEWLAARLKLLEAEKELTRQSDEVALRRQELPWVRVDKNYEFETDEGRADPHLPTHVRTRLCRSLPLLLGDRGRIQRLPDSLGQS